MISCQRVKSGTLMRLPVTNRRKAGMTSSHHAPYDLGYTRATMGGTERSKLARASQSHKTVLSSDRSLQPDSVKSESLVISGQHTEVNTFPGLVHTARHTTRVCNTRRKKRVMKKKKRKRKKNEKNRHKRKKIKE